VDIVSSAAQSLTDTAPKGAVTREVHQGHCKVSAVSQTRDQREWPIRKLVGKRVKGHHKGQHHVWEPQDDVDARNDDVSFEQRVFT
jgi:hypothetical protein